MQAQDGSAGCEPTISVLIAALPGLSCAKVLNSLSKVDYPLQKIEVIIAEGKQPSRQRNEAVRAALGEIVHFFDDDCELSSELLRNVVRHYKNSEIVAVAGVATARNDAPIMSRAMHMAMGSWFGGCTARRPYRPTGGLRRADDKCFLMCNASIRRDTYMLEGGLRADLFPGEETEFFRRLYAKGYFMVYDPQAIVYRDWRTSLNDCAQAIFTYGRARIEQGIENYQMNDYLFFVPLAFLVYLFFLPFASSIYYQAVIWIYLALVVLCSLTEVVVRRDLAGSLLFVLFPLLHISFGAGLAWGCLKWPFAPKRQNTNDVNLKMIKNLGTTTICGF